MVFKETNFDLIVSWMSYRGVCNVRIASFYVLAFLKVAQVTVDNDLWNLLISFSFLILSVVGKSLLVQIMLSWLFLYISKLSFSYLLLDCLLLLL